MPEQYPSLQDPEPSSRSTGFRSRSPQVPSVTPADPSVSDTADLFLAKDGLRAGWSLLLFLLLITALFLPLRMLMASHQPGRDPASSTTSPRPAEQSVSNTIRQDGPLFLIVLLSSFVISRIERRPLAAYGLGPTPGTLPQLLLGLFWGLASLSSLVLVLTSTHLLVFSGRLLSGAAILRFGAQWAFAFLLVGLFEEYLLRGFLLFTLARGLSGIYAAILKSPHTDALGFWTAALLLSFVFGLGHRSNPGESSIGLLTASAAALVFTLSLWRTGSLWWAIGFHAAWDWAQSFLYGVADSGLMMRHHLFSTHSAGRPILSGGLTGPEGSLFVLPLLAIVSAVIWNTLPLSPLSFAHRASAAQIDPRLT